MRFPDPGARAPHYTSEVRTNPLAVLSLIFGCLPLPVLAGLVAVILGVVAMKQTQTSGEKGRLSAATGIVLGVLQIVLWVWLLVAAFDRYQF
jgi:hypothetical protein